MVSPAPAEVGGGWPVWPAVHYGKSSGTRRTFTLKAKISSFLGVLGSHVQFKRDLKVCRHYEMPLELSGMLENKAGSARLVFHSALASL